MEIVFKIIIEILSRNKSPIYVFFAIGILGKRTKDYLFLMHCSLLHISGQVNYKEGQRRQVQKC